MLNASYRVPTRPRQVFHARVDHMACCHGQTMCHDSDTQNNDFSTNTQKQMTTVHRYGYVGHIVVRASLTWFIFVSRRPMCVLSSVLLKCSIQSVSGAWLQNQVAPPIRLQSVQAVPPKF